MNYTEGTQTHTQTRVPSVTLLFWQSLHSPTPGTGIKTQKKAARSSPSDTAPVHCWGRRGSPRNPQSSGGTPRCRWWPGTAKALAPPHTSRRPVHREFSLRAEAELTICRKDLLSPRHNPFGDCHICRPDLAPPLAVKLGSPSRSDRKTHPSFSGPWSSDVQLEASFERLNSGLRGPMAQTPMSVVYMNPHVFRTSVSVCAVYFETTVNII